MKRAPEKRKNENLHNVLKIKVQVPTTRNKPTFTHGIQNNSTCSAQHVRSVSLSGSEDISLDDLTHHLKEIKFFKT